MTIEERIKALEDRVSALEDTETPREQVGKKPTSIREFINSIKPSTANDTVIVIAYYYEILNNGSYFTLDNLREGYSQAKMIAPKNFSDVIAKNSKKGLIMSSSNADTMAKAWVLTNTGEAYVEEMMKEDD